MPNDAPMSVADFASKVKAKYPEYQSIPDEDLARKIVAKHPEYQSKVQFAPATPAPLPPSTIGPRSGAAQTWDQVKAGFHAGGAGSGLPQQPTMAGGVGQLARFLGETELNFGSGELGAAGLSKVISKATRAAEALNTVAKVANPVAIDTAKLDKIASKAMGMLGHSPTNAIRDYTKYREAGQPLTFEQARDLYSAASSKTAEESSRVSSKMKSMGVAFTKALHEELTAAADSVGHGDTYAKAIKDYGQAKQLYRSLAKAAKYGVAAAGAGAMGRAGYQAAKYFGL